MTVDRCPFCHAPLDEPCRRCHALPCCPTCSGADWLCERCADEVYDEAQSDDDPR